MHSLKCRLALSLGYRSSEKIIRSIGVFSQGYDHLVDEVYIPGMTEEEGIEAIRAHPLVKEKTVKNHMYCAVNQDILPPSKRRFCTPYVRSLVELLYAPGMTEYEGEKAVREHNVLFK